MPRFIFSGLAHPVSRECKFFRHCRAGSVEVSRAKAECFERAGVGVADLDSRRRSMMMPMCVKPDTDEVVLR